LADIEMPVLGLFEIEEGFGRRQAPLKLYRPCFIDDAERDQVVKHG
jgi:hypothetical protein